MKCLSRPDDAREIIFAHPRYADAFFFALLGKQPEGGKESHSHG